MWHWQASWWIMYDAVSVPRAVSLKNLSNIHQVTLYVLSKFKIVGRYLGLHYLFFHFTVISRGSFRLEVVQTGLVESEDWSDLYFPCFPLLQLVFLVGIVLRDKKFQSTNVNNQTCSLEVCRKSPGNRLLQFPSATKLKTYQSVIKGPGAVKCELGFDYLCIGKVGFETLVIGFGHVFPLLGKLGSASSLKQIECLIKGRKLQRL